MDMRTRAGTLTEFTRRLHRWRQAEGWVSEGHEPDEIAHGTEDDVRWAEVDGERFTEDDILWLRRSVMLDSIDSVAGRTTWQEWPETCARSEGPQPPARVEQIRMRLKTDDDAGPFYLYCAAATTGPAGPAGPASLYSFRKDEDPTPPADATLEATLFADESDDLDWLAALTIREHLPAHPA